MRNRTLSAEGRLLALRKVHHDLLEQLTQLQKLREQLCMAERKARTRARPGATREHVALATTGKRPHHSYDKDRAALVFDLMGPLRPVVDRVVLNLVGDQTFEPGDFTIRTDGVFRLNPSLANRLVKPVESSTTGQVNQSSKLVLKLLA